MGISGNVSSAATRKSMAPQHSHQADESGRVQRGNGPRISTATSSINIPGDCHLLPQSVRGYSSIAGRDVSVNRALTYTDSRAESLGSTAACSQVCRITDRQECRPPSRPADRAVSKSPSDTINQAQLPYLIAAAATRMQGLQTSSPSSSSSSSSRAAVSGTEATSVFRRRFASWSFKLVESSFRFRSSAISRSSASIRRWKASSTS